MGFTNRVRTIIILLSDILNPLARGNGIIISSSRMVGNKAFPKHRNTLTAHLLTTITHEIRSIFNNIPIFISHSHAINIEVRLGKFIITTIAIGTITSARATIRESSSFTILLKEILIIQLLVRSRGHNRHTLIGKANNLIINFLALMELTLKEICVLLAEHIRTIEAAFPVIQHSATSARYISIFINGSAITMHNSIQKSSLIALKHRKITGALRSAMHLQSNLNKVIRLKSVKIIGQLLRISMLDKQRGNRSFLLAHMVPLAYMALTILTHRNILLTNLMSIQSSECETFSQLIKKDSSIRNTTKMEE